MPSKRSDDLRHLWLFLAAAAIVAAIYFLRPILTPFLFAAILAYICDPLVDRLERRKVPRGLGTALVLLFLVLMLALFLLVLVPMLVNEVQLFAARTPAYLDALNAGLQPWLKDHLAVDIRSQIPALKQMLADNWQGAGGFAAKFLPSLKTGGAAFLAFIGNAVLIPVVLFYLLRDWDIMVAHIDDTIPRRWQGRVAALARDVDHVLAEFLRGQILVMVIMAAYYAVALSFAGLDYAVPIGLIAGLLVFVPYLGIVSGLLLATLAGLLQFQGLGGLVPVWIVFGIGHTLESMAITPWLVGERIGLHPVVVIFALLAFGQLFGFFGILLALPASAALLVWFRHLRRSYLNSTLYKD